MDYQLRSILNIQTSNGAREKDAVVYEEQEDSSLPGGTPLRHFPGGTSSLLLMQEKRKTHSRARHTQHLEGSQCHMAPDR